MVRGEVCHCAQARAWALLLTRGEQRSLLTREELRRQAVEAFVLRAKVLHNSSISLPVLIRPKKHPEAASIKPLHRPIRAIKHKQALTTEHTYSS